MSGEFDASASLAGYLYQCRLALRDALRRLRTNAAFKVSIEKLDDVAFETAGSPTELLQVKHRIVAEADLSDASTALWKTLRVWLDGTDASRWGSDSILYLVTSGRVADGNAAAHLRTDDRRDVSKARERLDSIAMTSTNASNIKAYAAYNALSIEQRLQVLERVVVLDGEKNIWDVDTDILEVLALSVERERVAQCAARLEGWWLAKVINHLRDGSEPILSEELDAELDQIRDEFRADNLPIDRELLAMEIDAAKFEHHMFVAQLNLINLIPNRVRTAMREYFRAAEHRSRWIREGFVLPGELKAYDERLVEEWQLRFDAMAQDLADDLSETRKIELARMVYRWAEQEADFPVRHACTERFVGRGSLQILADAIRIGWHIDYATLIKPSR